MPKHTPPDIGDGIWVPKGVDREEYLKYLAKLKEQTEKVLDVVAETMTVMVDAIAPEPKKKPVKKPEKPEKAKKAKKKKG